MLNYMTKLFNRHERDDQDQGSWTPVSYGTSWEMAHRIASSMTRFMSDYDHIEQHEKKAAATIVASELVLARATPGTSVESIAKQFWPENAFDEPVMDHWQWVLSSLEELSHSDNPFQHEEEDWAFLSSFGTETIDEACSELQLALEWLQPSVNLSPIKFTSQIGEAYSGFQRVYTKPYAQPWDAPDTLELALIRRGQVPAREPR